MIDQHALSLAIRWLHVAAMAFLFGGALLLWLTLRGSSAAESGVVRAAVAYERGVWVALGLIVMTGVGNIAAFGTGLPGPATPWGGAFLWKMAFVVALLALAVIRSLVIAQVATAVASLGAEVPLRARPLEAMYGASSLVLAGVVALAMVMTRG